MKRPGRDPWRWALVVTALPLVVGCATSSRPAPAPAPRRAERERPRRDPRAREADFWRCKLVTAEATHRAWGVALKLRARLFRAEDAWGIRADLEVVSSDGQPHAFSPYPSHSGSVRELAARDDEFGGWFGGGSGGSSANKVVRPGVVARYKAQYPRDAKTEPITPGHRLIYRLSVTEITGARTQDYKTRVAGRVVLTVPATGCPTLAVRPGPEPTKPRRRAAPRPAQR